MTLQDATKSISSQRKKHSNPFNLLKAKFQMRDIYIEKFSTFGNILEDAEQHLFKFKCTCEIFDIYEDNFICILFAQTLCGNALEWFFSLLLGTITSWDVLETLFTKEFIPYVVAHPPFPTWTQKDEMNDSKEEYHEILQEFFESNLVAENEVMNSKEQ